MMRFVPASAQHVGSRSEQQDAFGFSDQHDSAFVAHAGFLAVLADGMGGMSHGRAAGLTGVQAFIDAYAAKSENESIVDALDRAVRHANSAVYALSHELGEPGQIGSTLVACAVHHDQLCWVSVGDSAIFLYRNGELARLTTGHTYSVELDRAVAAGAISSEQALYDPQREALTSYLGIENLAEIELPAQPVQLFLGDRILLASDGLFKSISDEEIKTCLSPGMHGAMDRLIELALSKNRSYQDNITVLGIEVMSEEAPVESTGSITQSELLQVTSEESAATVPSAPLLPDPVFMPPAWSPEPGAPTSSLAAPSRRWIWIPVLLLLVLAIVATLLILRIAAARPN
jgi:PPM family protein phosphatase